MLNCQLMHWPPKPFHHTWDRSCKPAEPFCRPRVGVSWSAMLAISSVSVLMFHGMEAVDHGK